MVLPSPYTHPQSSLFSIANQLDPNDTRLPLARELDWDSLEAAFGTLLPQPCTPSNKSFVYPLPAGSVHQQTGCRSELTKTSRSASVYSIVYSSYNLFFVRRNTNCV